MLVKEVMSTGIETVAIDASIQEAARKMAAEEIGCLAVRDGGTMVGVLTDRNITIRGVAEGRPPNTPVSEVMTKAVAFVRPDTDASEAARTMEASHIRRVVVLDDSDRLCGIVSIGDLAARVGEGELGARVLRNIHSTP